MDVIVGAVMVGAAYMDVVIWLLLRKGGAKNGEKKR